MDPERRHIVRRFLKDSFKATYLTDHARFQIQEDIWNDYDDETQNDLIDKVRDSIDDDDILIYNAIRRIPLDEDKEQVERLEFKTLRVIDITTKPWKIIRYKSAEIKLHEKFGDDVSVDIVRFQSRAFVLGNTRKIRKLKKDALKLVKDEAELLTLLIIAVRELKNDYGVVLLIPNKLEAKPYMLPREIVSSLLKKDKSKVSEIKQNSKAENITDPKEKLGRLDDLWIDTGFGVITKNSKWFAKIATTRLKEINVDFKNREEPPKKTSKKKSSGRRGGRGRRVRKTGEMGKISIQEIEIQEAKESDMAATWTKVKATLIGDDENGCNFDDKKRKKVRANLLMVLRVSDGETLSKTKSHPMISKKIKNKKYFNLASAQIPTPQIVANKKHVAKNYVVAEVPAGKWFKANGRTFSIRVLVNKKNYKAQPIKSSHRSKKSEKEIMENTIEATAQETLTFIYTQFMEHCFSDTNFLEEEDTDIAFDIEEKSNRLEEILKDVKDIEGPSKTPVGRFSRSFGQFVGVNSFLLNQLQRIPEDVHIPGEAGDLPPIDQPEKEKEFGVPRILRPDKKNVESLLNLEKDLLSFKREEKDTIEILKKQSKEIEVEKIDDFEESAFPLTVKRRVDVPKLLETETRFRSAQNKFQVLESLDPLEEKVVETYFN